MTSKIVVDVATEPVSLAEARLQCKLDSDDTTWDAWLTAARIEARQWCERETGRALAAQTREMVLDEFPDGDILVDMPPVSAVTSIKYDDENGAEQTLATSVYAFSAYGEFPRRISLKADQEWPATRAQADAVRVLYVTGSTPASAKAAILLHIELTFPNNPISPAERELLERARDSLLATLVVPGF